MGEQDRGLPGALPLGGLWGERWGLGKADIGAWGLPVAGAEPGSVHRGPAGTGMALGCEAPQWLSSSRGLCEERGQLDDMDMGSCLMVTPKNCWPPRAGGWCWWCWCGWCMDRGWGAVGEGALSCVDP